MASVNHARTIGGLSRSSVAETRLTPRVDLMLAWLVEHGGSATVDNQVVTGHETARVTGQIQGRFSNVIGHTGFLQRHRSRQTLLKFVHFALIFLITQGICSLRAAPKNRCGNCAGRDRIYPNVVLAQLDTRHSGVVG